ncbi:sugar ABC transporter ATP-binding protein [Christensenella intestinihominis]|uniref:sugar ABC transporter ATP-binding protein n=1 Tax=Christensenella intestinihominis TaxID=1851429 RepID=UPI000829F58C|nr:sugar ABC transporter ATP-binding protein [Christensenella intestinihominis]
MQDYILEVKDLCKYYPGVKALDGVSVGFQEGEVHALAGENGAGKSTLIKMLTGAIEPTRGEIILNGETYHRLGPIEAIEKGISAVYQEFNLIPYLTVAENVFYGKEIMKGAFVDKKAMAEEVSKALEEFEIELDPLAVISDLGVAYQQITEIVKAVMANSRVLIMDEPTAPLTSKETQLLFNIVKKLKKNKVTIIFISHRMEEMFEICDRVTVLRDGKYISTKDVKDITRKELITDMVGRELGENYPERVAELGEPVLQVKGLTNEKIKDVSFEVRKGEILGFGGLVGAGRTEVMQALFGADPIEDGEIFLNGKRIKIKNPGSALNHGIGLLPEDRKNQGVLLGLTIKENVTFSSLKQAMRGPFVDSKKDTAIAEEYVNKLQIKTPSINQLVKNLSGGNQQKVVLAKMLATQCDVIIFDEPTRGIDVGAKQEIYNLMRHLADDEEKTVIMVSSEMPELIGMSDRILVMRGGRIVGELGRNEFSQELILEYASGLIGG